MNTPRPQDHGQASTTKTHEDACTSGPQASIGTAIDNAADDDAPNPPHEPSIRTEIDGSEDGDDAEEMVYDDRTDDRPV